MRPLATSTWPAPKSASTSRAARHPTWKGALFEADHGDPGTAVQKAKQVYAAAPSVRGADALGWALTRDGKPERGLAFAEEALRLGTRSPLFLFHAGIAAKRAGEDGAARAYLSRALGLNPGSRRSMRREPVRRSRSCNERSSPLSRVGIRLQTADASLHCPLA